MRVLPILRPLLCVAPVLATLAAVPARADVQPHGGLLRYPDVSATHVVFVYADDLWIVPREGGRAQPLASPPGTEVFPRFSPDGKTIVFTGNYDGNPDLYTLPVEGGVPHRVTYHPSAELACDWCADGRLLYTSNGFSVQGLMQLFRVAPDGGLPEPIPLPYADRGAISSDGTWLAYTPINRDQRTWKRYMGGLASDIWLLDLHTFASRRITDWGGTDTQPMWHGGVVYYLSDRDPRHKLNIWAFTPATGEHRQITFFADYDVKWPSMGPGPDGQGEIVFQYGAKLNLLNLATGATRALDVSIPGAKPTIRPQTVDAAENIEDFGISPNAERVVVEARGDVWTLAAEEGAPRDLTRTSGVAERSPAWSPDGRWIAYFTDESGNYELALRRSDGQGEPRVLTHDSQDFFSGTLWSPDSKHIAYEDQTGKLWVIDVEDGERHLVAESPQGGFGSRFAPSWSHDSAWLAFQNSESREIHSAVWVWRTADATVHQVTSGFFDDGLPVFGRKGDWLFLASRRHFQPSYSDLDTTFIYDRSQVLVALPLRADVKSPYLPESDEEKITEEPEKPADGAAPAEPAKPADEVTGTWAGTLEGTAPMPEGPQAFILTLARDEAGQLTGTFSTPGGSGPLKFGVYTAENHTIAFTVVTTQGQTWVVTGTLEGDAFTGTAYAADMGVNAKLRARRMELPAGAQAAAKAEEPGAGKGAEEKEEKPLEIELEGIQARAIELPVEHGNFGQLAVNDQNALVYSRRSRDGGPAKIMLFSLDDEDKTEKEITTGAGFDITPDGKKLLVVTGRGPSGQILDARPGAKGKPVSTAGMTITIDPPAEWHQIFVEAWRLYRQYFYDPHLHGVDWDAMRARYEPMLASCVTREEVAYVIRELISELNVGHAYYRGSRPDGPRMNVGLLGCDFELSEGAYRIASILRGAPWDVDARGPLDQPGLDVHEGDYVLAVDGVPVDTSKDPWAAFQGVAGRSTTLTVSSKPTLDDDARQVVVTPVPSEGQLRYRAWIEKNRRHVEEKSGGKVGYVYVPSTGIDGQNDLVRQYFGQIGKPALLIDERFNRGGQIPTRFIELLNRPVLHYFATRQGEPFPWPYDGHHGPMAMLINERAGSGGDAFPSYFRQMGLGKLIGKRTWGGLVGISGNPGFIDGTGVTVPTFGYYEKNGTWGIEGYGVPPDIEVEADPSQLAHGIDPQLDAGITHLLGELEQHAWNPTPKPKGPDRSGMGVREQDK